MQFRREAPNLVSRRRNSTQFMSLQRWSSTYTPRHFSNAQKQRSAIVGNVMCVAIADGKRSSFVRYRKTLQCVGQGCRVELGEHLHEPDIVAD